MKKYVLFALATIAMVYAACSTHYYGVNNSKSSRHAVTNNTGDTTMGGDAMKKDSTLH